MADDDDALLTYLHLNTLARFSKRHGPSQLALEEYGHCEVPAGCGGVVMRWRDPRAGIDALVELSLTRPGRVDAHLDGVPLESARVALGFGAHVLDLFIELPHDAPTHLLVAATIDRADALDDGHGTPIAALCSRADGSWRVAELGADAPAKPSDYDAKSSRGAEGPWPFVAMRGDTRCGVDDALRWRVDALQQRGAEALTLPRAPLGRLLVRHRFGIDAAASPPAPRDLDEALERLGQRGLGATPGLATADDDDDDRDGGDEEAMP